MAQPVTTLIPFPQLPACAFKCGPFHDANGACVPPAAPVTDETTYERCFCQYGALQPFRQGTSGVCDYAGCDAEGFRSIQSWFTNFCGYNNGAGPTGTNTSPSSGATRGSSSGGTQARSGDWLSNHWQYVIMLVILVVGIAGIWIGACIWRRRYLKRKDRAYELGKHSGSSAAAHNSWGPGAGGSNHGPTNSTVSGPGVFMPNASGTPTPYDEKEKARKKWVVNERT